MRKVDYLIIGQGIAGTMIAFFAKQTGKKIMVIDQSNPHSASNIAAGLINPITGRKFVKSWRIDDLLPFAIQTYQAFADLLGEPFFEQRNILRALMDEKDEANWFLRSDVLDFEKYIKEEEHIGGYKDIINAAYSYGEVQCGGQVAMKRLIDLYQIYLINQENYQSELFDDRQLEIEKDHVIYKDIAAQCVIFCEGIGIQQNRFFNYLPVQGNKGEVLIIKIPNAKTEKIIKQGLFIIPLGEELFWVGSTYFNDYENAEPSAAGKANLLERLHKILIIPFEIIKHQAAIRPTVPDRDRRPLIGVHSEFHRLALFNGVGTKGASVAPYWASRFIDCLENKVEIDAVVNIKRYDSAGIDIKPI